MRLIDTEDILVGCVKTGLKEYDTGKEAGIDLVLAIINHLPTIEAKPVVHAHWLITEYEYFDCSNCGRPIWNGCDSTAQAEQMLVDKEVVFQYCPYCGAQMDGKEK